MKIIATYQTNKSYPYWKEVKKEIEVKAIESRKIFDELNGQLEDGEYITHLEYEI